jgi:hypothetical protein
MDPALQRIDKLTEQRYPLVYFETLRSAHVTEMFKSLSLATSKAIYHWTPDSGLYRMDASHIMIPRSQSPRHLLELIQGTPHFGVYLLSDFGEAVNEQPIIDLIKKIIAGYSDNPKMIVMMGKDMNIPAELRPSVAHIRHTVRSNSETDSSRKAG